MDGEDVLRVPRIGLDRRVELYVAGTNILTTPTSWATAAWWRGPFFAEPTSAGPARKIELGARFGFW